MAAVCAFTDIDDNIRDYLKYGHVQIDSTEQAGQMIADGQVDEVTYYYLNRIDSAKDPVKKAELYLTLSVQLSLNRPIDQIFDTAMDYAQQADKLKPSDQTAAQISYLYQLKGDKANADKWLKVVQERSNRKSEEGQPNDTANMG